MGEQNNSNGPKNPSEGAETASPEEKKTFWQKVEVVEAALKRVAWGKYGIKVLGGGCAYNLCMFLAFAVCCVALPLVLFFAIPPLAQLLEGPYMHLRRVFPTIFGIQASLFLSSFVFYRFFSFFGRRKKANALEK